MKVQSDMYKSALHTINTVCATYVCVDLKINNINVAACKFSKL